MEPIANYIFFGDTEKEFPRFWNIVAETVNKMTNKNRCDLFLLLRIHLLNTIIKGINKTLKIYEEYLLKDSSKREFISKITNYLDNSEKLLKEEKEMDINQSMNYSKIWSKEFQKCSIYSLLFEYNLDIVNENKKIYNNSLPNKLYKKEK